jgi:hypothetical protein
MAVAMTNATTGTARRTAQRGKPCTTSRRFLTAFLPMLE